MNTIRGHNKSRLMIIFIAMSCPTYFTTVINGRGFNYFIWILL